MENKQRQKRFREKKIKDGFVLLRVWIKPEWKKAIQDTIKKCV